MAIIRLVLPVFLGLAACGGASPTSQRMTASRSVPAAEGSVKVEAGSSDNTSLLIEVRHMAPPQNLAPGATTFVVWAEAPAGGPPQNLGALDVGADRSGRLRTLTPLRRMRVFVTAEASAASATPSTSPLLSASIVR